MNLKYQKAAARHIQMELGSANAKSRKAIAVAVLVLILAIPAGTLTYLYVKMDIPQLQTGKAIPGVNLVETDGKTATLNHLKNGKAVILIFSAECPHCLQMLTVFDSLSRKFGQRLKFVALSVSKPDTTKELVRKGRVSFPVFLGNGQDIRNTFRISVVPTTLFVEKGLILRSEKYGEYDQMAEEKAVEGFIDGK